MRACDLVQPIVLASASPRRRELMTLTGLPFEVAAFEVDEQAIGKGEQRVAEIARRKALAAAKHYPRRIILAADTLVQVDEEVLGKPADFQDACRMLGRLSGRWHEVFTAICLVGGAADRLSLRVDQTRVKFSPLSPSLIEGYVNTGEPMDKAGAYGVQGRGGLFVEALEGSYSNVIGLPLALLRQMLEDELGLTVF